MSPSQKFALILLFAVLSTLAGATTPAFAEEAGPAKPVGMKIVYRAPGAADDYRLIVDSPVVAVDGRSTPEKGIGWWKDFTGAPAADTWGFYIAHMTPSEDGKIDAPFRTLKETKVGDEIWIKLESGLSATYIVTESIVLENALAYDYVNATRANGMITAMGCEGTKIWQHPNGERRTTDVRPGKEWKLVDRTHKRIVRAVFVGIW